jgi:hypothetical protein
MADFHFHARPAPAPKTAFADAPNRRVKLLWTLALALLLGLALLVFVELAHAGGPAHVAGASYFDAAVQGQSLAWAGGNILYYTDRGDLSSQLPAHDADAFVAEAFSRWTAVPTAALSATQAGQLAEDVNATNVTGYPDGTYTIPADIQPTATDKPVGVVYDADGAVTSALLGQGAGDAAYCFSNAVFGGPDAYSTDGHLAHALVVLNGVCASSAASLPDVKYRLVRIVGRVLGLDWSQLNNHVITRHPAPTNDDYAGFPLMHNFDPPGCAPISRCLPDPDSLKMDDRAAISRLYPVTPSNLAQFPGKQVSAATTGRIHGSVYFSDAAGNPTQPMTGVNVIARRIDTPGQPSGRYAASSVSGFAYAAIIGNIVNGYTNAAGQRYDRFGSNDAALEGFFDLAGLEIPPGAETAQYQLSVEGLDNYSTSVGPYAPWQVALSGTFDPLIVTVTRGGDVAQNIVMRDSAIPQNEIGIGSTYNTPSSLPRGGDWVGWLSGETTAHFFQINALANRTLSVELTALDEHSATVQNKILPVAGMWALTDGSGAPAPAGTPSAFNTSSVGVTRLDSLISQDGIYRIAIADQRGDARPDFRYHARVLYAHTVAPLRAGLEGGTPLTIRGLGFRPGMTATVGGVSAKVLAVSANQVTLGTPVLSKDGTGTIVVSDPATGSFTTMTNALTLGAHSTDSLQLLSTGNPSTAAGTETANPVRVRVTSADGLPVEGATIAWDGGPGTVLGACSMMRTCTVLSDENGEAWTHVTVMSAGTNTITATLAPASYTPPKSVQATVLGATSTLDIGLSPQYQRVPVGATLDMTLTARVVGSGAPIKNKTVTFQFTHGSGTLTPASATTNASGYASTTLHIDNASGDTDVVACVSPGNTVCKTFEIYSVLAANLRLQPVAGSGQMIAAGQPFSPLTLRVTDAATPPNPVRGAAVLFDCTWLRPAHDDGQNNNGESSSGHHTMPVVLGVTKTTVVSDAEGVVSLVPSPGSLRGTLEADVKVTAGTTARMDVKLESAWPAGTTAASNPLPNQVRRFPIAMENRNVRQE